MDSRRSLAVLLIVVALGVFVQRTYRQPQYKPADFAMVYTGSRAWIAGENPYDRNAALGHWISAGGRPDIMPADAVEGEVSGWMPILQAPPASVVLAPFALLPPGPAVALWYVFSAALLIAQTAALCCMMGIRLADWRAAALFGATLIFAPVHECFGWAQPSWAAIGLVIIGSWATLENRHVAGGILFALAAGFKPQLAGAFPLYFLLTRRWRVFAAFTIAFGLLFAVAIVPMQMHGIAWLNDWFGNISISESNGGVSSTSMENVARFTMLDLRLILYTVSHNRPLVNALAIAITLGMGGWFAWVRLRLPRSRRDELLALAVVSVLALLPVYHRSYDAAILVIPLAWGLANAHRSPRLAWPVLILASTLVVPLSALQRGSAMVGVDWQSAQGFWWDVVFMPSRVWIEIALYVALVRAAAANRSIDLDRSSHNENVDEDFFPLQGVAEPKPSPAKPAPQFANG